MPSRQRHASHQCRNCIPHAQVTGWWSASHLFTPNSKADAVRVIVTMPSWSSLYLTNSVTTFHKGRGFVRVFVRSHTVIPQFVILKCGFHIEGNAPPVLGAKAGAFSE